MYGRPSSSSGGAWGQPPQQPQGTNFCLQNPINSSYIYPSNPPFIPHNAHNPYQNFPPNNFPIQSPNFPVQNPGFNPPPQQFSNPAGFRPPNSRDMLERIDRAVGKARDEHAAAGENVSAWKVSQSALLMLNVDCWSSLGFQMQQVPTLHRLMLTEGKLLTSANQGSTRQDLPLGLPRLVGPSPSPTWPLRAGVRFGARGGLLPAFPLCAGALLYTNGPRLQLYAYMHRYV